MTSGERVSIMAKVGVVAVVDAELDAESSCSADSAAKVAVEVSGESEYILMPDEEVEVGRTAC